MSRVWSKFQEDIYRFVAQETGNLVVIARAGCGKTTTICEACNRIPRGKRVLVCAFNNKIRDELAERLKDMKHVFVKGMHQLGFAAIMRQRGGGRLDVDRYRIRDYVRGLIPDEMKEYRGDMVKLVAMCMANLALDSGAIKNAMYEYDLRPSAPAHEGLFIEWTQAALEYSRRPAASISFDEQVFLPAVMNLSTGAFDVVLVDEAQDLNACQYRIAMNAVKRGGRVIAVGDDRQAIYAFRGADSDAIGRLTRELKATVLPLSVTYRCPTKVVALAQRLVPDFESGDGAPPGEVRIVSEKEFLDGVKVGDAVISRTNSGLTKYCLSLLVGGKRARIIGRDLSAKLEAILARVTTNVLKDALGQMSAFVEGEVERLVAAKKDDKAEELLDNLEALRALSDGMTTVTSLRQRMNSLFAEGDGVEYGTIPCMTVHKAKGLEFDRVWLLESTFRVNTIEGENLYYVGITRTKHQLFLVQVPRADGSKVPSIALNTLGFNPNA